MAKVSRSQERTIADQQIYDNNAKEVTPEMVKLALDALIDSNYNLVDDRLQDQLYAGSQTLAQKLDEQSNGGVLLYSQSKEISILNQQTNSDVSGDTNMVMTVPSNGNHRNELRIDCTFPSVGTSNYMPVATWVINAPSNNNWPDRPMGLVSVGNLTATSLSIFLFRVANNPIGRVKITLLKID